MEHPQVAVQLVRHRLAVEVDTGREYDQLKPLGVSDNFVDGDAIMTTNIASVAFLQNLDQKFISILFAILVLVEQCNVVCEELGIHESEGAEGTLERVCICVIGKSVKVEMEICNMGSFAAYAVPKYKKINKRKEEKRIYCDL